MLCIIPKTNLKNPDAAVEIELYGNTAVTPS